MSSNINGKKSSREYIQSRFDSDGITAPESLSEESMLRMLEAAGEAADGADGARKEKMAEQKRRPLIGKPAARRLAAVAAAAVIAVTGIAGISEYMNTAPDTAVRSGELYTFGSENEIRRTVNSLDPSSPLGFIRRDSNIVYEEELEYSTGMGDPAVSDAEVPRSAGADSDSVASGSTSAKSVSSSAASSEAHSSTYLQVDEVDEADIVKTDGKYIYYVRDSKDVVILSAENGRTETVAVIGSSGPENYVEDIYLKGDTLVTVGRFYGSSNEDGDAADDEGRSGIVIYDISDRSRPKAVSDFSQTGDIVTSRMSGNYLYLVTNDYVRRGGRILPQCGSSGELSGLAADDISCVPQPQQASYIVLSAIDISSGSQGKARTKAVFGSTQEVYCNDRNMYSASPEWSADTDQEYTRIVRARLDGTDVRFDATTKVRGHLQSQFAMDERDGFFRTATTSQRAGMDVNNLFVLDKNLKEAGKVTGFARNESIKAVRFIGSKAYVITYEAIDPLFVIDLSDPAAPRIEGEVKIDGFSTLLIPVSGSRLLGIGHATGDNGYGGEYDSGLKLALFDISDPSKPKVLDSREFEDMSSPAQSDHHALTVNTEEGWFAIPYDIWKYADDVFIVEDEESSITDGEAEDAAAEGEDAPAENGESLADPDAPIMQDYHETGVLIFNADDSISVTDKHRLKGDSILRSVYIGDYIYALDSDGEAKSFRVK